MNDISLYEKVPSLNNNFTVKFLELRGIHSLLPHWHEHIELLYFTSGKCQFRCNCNEFSAVKGDIVVVNSTEIHSFISDENVNYFCILIYPEFFSDIEFPNIIFNNLIQDDDYIKACLNDIYEEYTQNLPGSDMMMKSHTYRLMAHLRRNYENTYVTERELEAHTTMLRRLNFLLEYISENYNEKITTYELSKMCYLSESHFCRFFKKAIGKSVTQYINEYRVEKATILLANTDESIASVSVSVGFDNINYFSRVFKQIKNISPREYRQQST